MDDAAHEEDRRCWLLVGPTASGKSAVAMILAERREMEIVSVDSMQVYRGMDIGTAKPTPRERARVPHHMIDVLDPEDPCSVGWFAREALAAVAGIRAGGRRPLLVGGSPLYLKGILWGLEDAPPRDALLRERLKREAECRGGPFLHERLARVDPGAAARIHPNDVHRIVRSLEMAELTGRAAGPSQEGFKGQPRLPHVAVGLRWPREELYRRIDQRVDGMIAAGLAAEARALRGRLGPQARHALGYKEFASNQAGRADEQKVAALIKRNTRRYAKHQATWFRHFPQVRWVDIQGREDPRSVAERCLRLFPGPP